MPNFGIFRGFSDKLFGDKLFAGQLPTQLGTNNPYYIGVLDDFPNAAAAYSLRLLRYAYSGSAIRVRRSSDNAETDIGFVNFVLDTSALTTFCGSGNGFVTTWYDQSGNGRNATQTTAANQPQIVSSGVVILNNSKPTVQFDGVNDILQRPSFGFPTNNITCINVNSRIDSTTSFLSLGYQTAGLIVNNGSTRIGFDGRPGGGGYDSANSNVTPTLSQILQFNVYDRVNLKASANNNAFGTTAVSTSSIIYSSETFDIGGISSFSLYGKSNQTEIVIYPTDESTNRSGINTNINDFYSIY